MALRADNRLIRTFTMVAIACTAIAACGLVLMPGGADAKKAKKSAKAKKLPSVSSFSPSTVPIGGELMIKGKNFTGGKNKMLVIFKRAGGHRYLVKGTATSKTEMSVLAPNVAAEVSTATAFPIRLVNRYGMMKKFTTVSKSPIIDPTAAAVVSEDCDLDGVPNDVDTDDDNDLLPDTTEAAIGADKCNPDTDGDDVSDYYEYRVASDFNGSPTLPFPWRNPTPDPLAGDSSNDLDGDGLTMLDEYHLWKFTGRMDRFYSDVLKDSDGNGKPDPQEDEDQDLLSNIVELQAFVGASPLQGTSFVSNDSDGDGLCDGLDDQDHDGTATPVSVADCTSEVPNNVTPGDPNPGLIDGDDNPYSNIGEILNGTDPYDACDPLLTSPYCTP